MSSPTPARRLRRLSPPSSASQQPASPRWAILKLLAASLVLGLVLVSLDITPSSMLAMADDIGPLLAQWGHTLRRAAEVLLGCLVGGGVLILPFWLVRRWRRKPAQLPLSTPAKPLSVAIETKPAPEPAKATPVAKTP